MVLRRTNWRRQMEKEKAVAAERELAKALQESKSMTAAARLQLQSLDAEDEHDELLTEISKDIAALAERAASDAGERKKYMKACEQSRTDTR